MNKRISRFALWPCGLFPAALAAHVPGSTQGTSSGTFPGAEHCALGWPCTWHAFEHLFAAVSPLGYLTIGTIGAIGVGLLAVGNLALRRLAAKAFQRRMTSAG